METAAGPRRQQGWHKIDGQVDRNGEASPLGGGGVSLLGTRAAKTLEVSSKVGWGRARDARTVVSTWRAAPSSGTARAERECTNVNI